MAALDLKSGCWGPNVSFSMARVASVAERSIISFASNSSLIAVSMDFLNSASPLSALSWMRPLSNPEIPLYSASTRIRCSSRLRTV